MFAQSFSPQSRPLFYIGKWPIHMVTLLVLIHAAVLVAFALGGPSLQMAAVDQLGFSGHKMGEGKFWTPITYVLLTFPTFWDAVGLVFFYMFGRNIEDRFGRSFVGWSYFWITVIPAVILLLVYLVAGSAWPLMGASSVHFGFFIGFCFLYPDMRFFNMFPAKWFGAFLVAINTLSLLDKRQSGLLIALWISIIGMYWFMRRAGIPARFAGIKNHFKSFKSGGKRRTGNHRKGYRSSRKALSVVKKGSKPKQRYEPKIQPTAQPPSGSTTAESIDHLLEKIASDGMASLTDEERAQLAAASSDLANKDKDK